MSATLIICLISLAIAFSLIFSKASDTMRGLGVFFMLVTITIVAIPSSSLAGLIDHHGGSDSQLVNKSTQLTHENRTGILTNMDPRSLI